MIYGNPITLGGGSGGGFDPSDALIHVNAPYGSTVTLSKNSVTVKVLTPSDAFPNVDGETADYYYPVSSSNFGTWDITATLGGNTDSETIAINAAEQYDSKLLSSIVFVNSGVLTTLPWIVATSAQYPGAAVTQESGDVLFTTGTVMAATVFGTRDNYDLTNYNTLRLVVMSGQSYFNSGKAPCFGIGRNRPTGSGSSASVSNFDYKTMLNNSTGVIGMATYSVDVSALSGLFYVGVSLAGSSNMSAESGKGFVRVIDFGIYK